MSGRLDASVVDRLVMYGKCCDSVECVYNEAFMMAAEIKDRRAADLSPAEVEALTAVRHLVNGCMMHDTAVGAPMTQWHRLSERALAVLNRLLAGGGGK